MSCLSRRLLLKGYFYYKNPPETAWTLRNATASHSVLLLGQLDSGYLSDTLRIQRKLGTPLGWGEIVGLRLLLLSVATLQVSYGIFLCYF